MEWLSFAYSLPAKSSTRVAAWRRLRRLGSIPPVGGIHLLPSRDDCAEALQWLAQEIRQAEGEALVMRVSQVEGRSDQELIAMFQAARSTDYADLDRQIDQLESELGDRDSRERLMDAIARLRRRHNEIARNDYFDCPAGAQVAARLTSLSRRLAAPAVTDVAPAAIEQYRHARWVTRPRPHVDRLACAWLIRRFINPDANIRYATIPEPDEVAFDMPDAQFGHLGVSCSFETMLRAFGFSDPALQTIAEIVHAIDLRDGRYAQPEIEGIAAILQGWLLNDLSDAEREARGVALFEGLYAALHNRPGASL